MEEMKVLGNEKVGILSSQEMKKRFGEILDYVVDPEKIVYINLKIVKREMKAYGSHLTSKEVVEDIYRHIRDIEISKSNHEILRDTIKCRR